MIGEEFVHQERWRLKKGAKPKHLLDTATRTRNIHRPLTTLSTNQVVKKKHYSRSKNISSILGFPCRESSAVVSNNTTTQCSSNPIDVSLPLDSANISITSQPESPHTIELNGHSTADVPFFEQVNLAEASVGCNDADSAIDALAFQSLQKNVKLPSNSWNWNYNGKTAACMTWLDTDYGNVVIKTLRVLSITRLPYHIGGKLISLPNGKCSYRDYDELSGFIKTLDRQNVCKGIANSLVVNVTEKFVISRDGDVSRSSRCSSLSNANSELCTRCSKALRSVRFHGYRVAPSSLIYSSKTSYVARSPQMKKGAYNSYRLL
ncbi:hypothetical protein OUZ56_012983 [Daphnia magna]|uniref:Uncharacterized protein n=1 Tax=Daphnia magna TaxID=35525 RepID=A0ABQ9Z4K8_9CRUS|nr:hypothetical protein OUZ56_012983 [Daphnia magna]